MTRKVMMARAACATFAGLTVLIGLDTQAAVTYRTVFLRGDVAPGTGAGVNFIGFGYPPRAE